MTQKELVAFFNRVVDYLALRQPLSSDQMLKDLVIEVSRKGYPQLSEWLNLFLVADYPIKPDYLRGFGTQRKAVETELGADSADSLTVMRYLDILSTEIESPLPWAYRRYGTELKGRELSDPTVMSELVETHHNLMNQGVTASIRARDLCQQVGHTAGQAFFQDVLTKIAFEQHDFVAALVSSKAALALWEQVIETAPQFGLQLAGSYRWQARILQNQPQPRLHEACKLGDMALKAVENYVTVLEQLDERYRENSSDLIAKHLEAHIRRSLSGALRDSNRLDRARRYCERSLEIFKELYNSKFLVPVRHRIDQRDIIASIAATHETLAGIYLGTGQHDSGYEHCKESQQRFQEFDDTFEGQVDILFYIYYPSRTQRLLTMGRILEARALEISDRQKSFAAWERIETQGDTSRVMATPQQLWEHAAECYQEAGRNYKVLIPTQTPSESAFILETVAKQRLGVVELLLGRPSQHLEEAVATFRQAEAQNFPVGIFLAAALGDQAEAIERTARAQANQTSKKQLQAQSLSLYQESVKFCRNSFSTLSYDEYNDVYKGRVERAYLRLIAEDVNTLGALPDPDVKRYASDSRSIAFRLIGYLEDLRYFDINFLRSGDESNAEMPPGDGLHSRLKKGNKLYRDLSETGSHFLWVQNTLNAENEQRVAFVFLSCDPKLERLVVHCELSSEAFTKNLQILGAVLPVLLAKAPPVATARGPLIEKVKDSWSETENAEEMGKSPKEKFRELTWELINALKNQPVLLKIFLKTLLDTTFDENHWESHFQTEPAMFWLKNSHTLIEEFQSMKAGWDEELTSLLGDHLDNFFDVTCGDRFIPTPVLMVHRLVNALGRKLFAGMPPGLQNEFREFKNHVAKRQPDQPRPVIFLSPCAKTINVPFELFKDYGSDDEISGDLKPNDEEHWLGYLGISIFMPRMHSMREVTDIHKRQFSGQKVSALLTLVPRWKDKDESRGDAKEKVLSEHTISGMRRMGEMFKKNNISLTPDGLLLEGPQFQQENLERGLLDPHLAFSFYTGHGIYGDGAYSFSLTMGSNEKISLWTIRNLLTDQKRVFPNTIFIFHTCEAGRSVELPGNRFRGLPTLLLQAGGSCVVASSYPVWQKSDGILFRAISRNFKKNSFSRIAIDERTGRSVAFLETGKTAGGCTNEDGTANAQTSAARTPSPNTRNMMADLLTNSRVDLAKRTCNPLEWCLFVLYGNPWCYLPVSDSGSNNNVTCILK